MRSSIGTVITTMLVLMITPTLVLAEWRATGPDGGDIQDLWFDPLNNQRAIVATSLNGQFETTDGGVSYQLMPASPLSPENPEVLARTNRIISATNSPQTLFMATGAFGGNAGIFKSEDGGSSWQEMNDGLVIDEVYPQTLDLVSSLDGAVIYLATSIGVFASFDRSSWTPLSFTERTQFLARSPTNIARLYAASTPDGVFRTDDGGVSWHPINDGLSTTGASAFAVDADMERLFQSSIRGQIDISDDLGETWTPAVTGLIDGGGNAFFNDIHAVSNSDQVFATSSFGVFRSNDNGTTWALLSTPPEANAMNRLTSSSDGTLFLLARTGLYVSDDGGDSWVESHTGIRARHFEHLQTSPVDGSWYVDAETLFRSTDQGASWVDIGEQSDQSNYTSALSLSSSDPDRMYAANALHPLVSGDAGQNWTALPAPGLGSTTIRSWTDPTDDQTVIMADFGSGTFSLQFAGLYRSTDGGLSWTRTFEAPLDRVNFQPHSVADDPTTPGTVYFGVHSRTGGAFTDGLVLRSTDHGASFEVVLDGMAFTQVIVDAAGHVYAAGTRDSITQGVWRSTDGGNNWGQFSNGLPAPFNTFDLAAHPSRPGHIFATNGFDIYESTNGGGSWYELQDIGQTDFTLSLAVIPDPVHDYTLLAAAYGNIFIGQDLAPDDPLAIPSSNRIGLGLLALALLLMAAVSLGSRRQPRM